MFGRKPPTGAGDPISPSDRLASDRPGLDRLGPSPFSAVPERPAPSAPPRSLALADAQPGSPRPAPAAAANWGSPAPGQPPRRPAEPVRPVDAAKGDAAKGETVRDVRKLIVGRDINLSGEITACDYLIVEGTVEARVRDCFRLEVAQSGLFQGSVEISEAEIAGRFLGELIVQGRLSVRATGKVEGTIHYGELAVDAGGTLDGEVRVNGKKKIAPPEEDAAAQTEEAAEATSQPAAADLAPASPGLP